MKTQDQDGKIISIGELLVEFIPVEPELRLHEEGAVFKTASGSSGIFACAVAQISGRAAFIGKVGRDSLSRFVFEVMEREGVDMSRVRFSEEGQIGLSFVENLPDGRNFQYYRQNSVGSRFSADDVDEDYIRSASAIHYSGMLLEVSPEMRGACVACVETARKNGVLVSFDPNIRKEVLSSAEARDRLADMVRKADVIAPTLEEARFVTGKQEIREILRQLHDMGPSVVALTRDKDGAVLSMGGKVVYAGGTGVQAVDPTGAGDTFAAMLVNGVLEGWTPEKTALYCNCAGSLAVTKQGSVGRALPSLAQVEEMAASRPCTLTVEGAV